MAIRLKHDALFKKILTQQEPAREFLNHYLPETLKNKIDLTQITIEKESYVEPNLKRSFSDLVYSVQTKDHDKAFVYIIDRGRSKIQLLDGTKVMAVYVASM